MSRPSATRKQYSKALPTARGEIEIIKAVTIWSTYLQVYEHKFESPASLTEKELSCRTWQGCSKSAYEEDPGKYRRLNNIVMEKIRDLYKGTKKAKIERISGQIGGQATTKICRSTRRQARDKQKHVLSMAAGCMASALSQNERHKLGTDVGGEFTTQLKKKVDTLPITDKKKELAFAETMKEAVAAGVEMGREEVLSGVLEVLNNSPRLIAADKKYNDDLTKINKKMRKA